MPKWWPFGKKEKSFEQHMDELREWAELEMAAGKTRQDICALLLKGNSQIFALNELQARAALEKELFNVFVERNMEGSKLEKSGNVDGAMALYLANVNDGFVGTHPYERLRIIYAKRKDFEKAAVICERFVVLPDVTKKKWAKYAEWAEKYRAKMAEK